MCRPLEIVVRSLASVIVLALVLPLVAQETRWTELNAQLEQLLKQEKYAEALPIAQEALRVAEATFGPEHPSIGTALNKLGDVYSAQRNYAAAQPLFRRSLAIREKALGPEHPDVAASLKSLGNLYTDQGEYAQAEPLYQRALAIREKALGPEHPDVAQSLYNLGRLYHKQGKYAQAEPLYQCALAIREKALGPEHPDVADSLNSLAALYYDQGKYAQAEPPFQRALAIREKALGPEHPDVATSLINVAVLYEHQLKYAQAEPLYQRALAIQEKALGPEHPDVAWSLINLAVLYVDQGKYAQAEPPFQRALAIREKALGPEHPYVAGSLNGLAIVYRTQGKYAQAEPVFQRALAIAENALGPEHRDVGSILFASANLYYAWGDPDRAVGFFEGGLRNLAKQFEYQFPYMSEKDRLLFLNIFANAFPSYFSFCLTYRGKTPALVGKMYDVLLWEKGFVANSIAALRAQVAATGDKQALLLFEQLTEKRTQLASLLNLQPENREEWHKMIDQLDQEANELEKKLVGRSSSLAEDKRLTQVTWRDIQKSLKKDEAAIEFVRFPVHDGRHFTGTAYYVALIVTPESRNGPIMVALGEADTLEHAPMRDYRRHAGLSTGSTRLTQPSFYEAFWKPLENTLQGKKRIYLSPDGILNQVAFGIAQAADGRLLIEHYDLRLVSSTKDILHERHASQPNLAVLVGNPQFNLDEATERAVVKSLGPLASQALVVADIGAAGLRSASLQRGGLKALPGTEVELQKVSSLLANHGWQVDVYSGERALAGVVKQVKAPRVLHLATHGFFLADQERLGANMSTVGEDPMLHSGLFFAGCDRVLSGAQQAADLDDGVLTAYEASGLNLQGTELVVLSACDTGLGEVKNGEGVFGLRRALQEAGAESVLMSLWAVPDRETQELMTAFYRKWLGGMDKYQALLAAQLEMRRTVKARYGRDLPFAWGGFVLVGY